MNSVIRAAIPLLFGWERVAMSVSIAGGPDDEWIDEPITGVLLETDVGYVLLDTGPSLTNIATERVRAGGRGLAGTVQIATDSPDDPLVATLRQYAGIGPSDVAMVAMSHLHFDHAGGLHHFAGRDVPVLVQRAEHEFAFSPRATAALGYFRDDYEPYDLRWTLMDGDQRVVPGLRALFCPGHTPGNQSFLVEIKSGQRMLFAFDTADLERNVREEIGVGFSIDVPPARTAESIRRIKSIAAELGASLHPGHCPITWPKLMSGPELR